MSQPKATTPPARRFDPKTLLQLTLFGLLALIWLALTLSTDTFFTEQNISNLVRQTSIGALVAFGQTFVIITAGIDLSVGAVVGLSGVVLALLYQAGVPFPVAVLLTLLLGAAIGLYHGFGVYNLGLPPFIMTLASLVGLRGVALLITNGQSIGGLPRGFTDFSQRSFFGVPSLFWMVIIVGVVTYVLLQRSRFGRYIYAVGSNLEASRLSGVKIGRYDLLGLRGVVGAGRAGREFCWRRGLASASLPPEPTTNSTPSPRRSSVARACSGLKARLSVRSSGRCS